MMVSVQYNQGEKGGFFFKPFHIKGSCANRAHRCPKETSSNAGFKPMGYI